MILIMVSGWYFLKRNLTVSVFLSQHQIHPQFYFSSLKYWGGGILFC